MQDEVGGFLQIFPYRTVLPTTGEAAAACTAPKLDVSQVCRLPLPSSSACAELAGLHLAADLLLERGYQDPGLETCLSAASWG